MKVKQFLFCLFLLAIAPAAFAQPPWLPVDPGKARCSTRDGVGQLENAALRFALSARQERLRPQAFDNRFTAAAHALTGELFSLKLRNGDVVAASSLHLQGVLACERIAAQPKAARAAVQRDGLALHARLRDEASGVLVDWRAVLRDGGNYVREEVRLQPPRELDVAAIQLVDLDVAAAFVDGTADGSPLVVDDRFFGFEHPMAQAKVIGGHASALLKRVLPLRAGVSVEYSAVLGVAPHGQLRRAFTAYLENERAHPARTFLHYNSWYDIGYFNRYTQDEALHAINAFGQKLVRERGVKIDSFLFDDGWDDPAKLWQFNNDFPAGFAPLRKAAAQYGAAPGIWLSPWGGYGAPRQQRLASARAAGYEVDEQGLALSGPKYFKLFHGVALKLLHDYSINQFKLDGTGSPDKVTPGSAFDSDFAAAIALIDDLRAIQPDLFINLTTGTWPSPFWLRTADSIWRGGEDHSFAGVGSDRQRWITYRDADTYGGIVRQGPLYPLDSLMLHGIIYAHHAHGLDSDPQGDFADEVHSYFASGTDLQELYISPDLLTEKNWDTLAQAAKWARERADVLRDSHWIGGDPARGAVYGWASWSPQRAVIALRNPGDHVQIFHLDPAAALELPDGVARTWRGASAWGGGDTQTFSAESPLDITLQPFEMRVWDLQPKVLR